MAWMCHFNLGLGLIRYVLPQQWLLGHSETLHILLVSIHVWLHCCWGVLLEVSQSSQLLGLFKQNTHFYVDMLFQWAILKPFFCPSEKQVWNGGREFQSWGLVFCELGKMLWFRSNCRGFSFILYPCTEFIKGIFRRKLWLSWVLWKLGALAWVMFRWMEAQLPYGPKQKIWAWLRG